MTRGVFQYKYKSGISLNIQNIPLLSFILNFDIKTFPILSKLTINLMNVFYKFYLPSHFIINMMKNVFWVNYQHFHMKKGEKSYFYVSLNFYNFISRKKNKTKFRDKLEGREIFTRL